ncbi:uncharacterized protein LOC111048141 [Nilaparvata lugens]|uniref:Salivap-4 n=1 Tax=Nilaparvata lugens TaxID=108931 RepID=A0A0A1H1H3_NILLU|nr:uncharacterized protein LOC111048141 [Nilaparvata lugens]ALL26998.1 salivary sheath protein a [Nilaparvata lugens]ANJ04678.1 salivap-4 [Nilaparvata lugens]ASL05007.1 salivary sheath protein nl031 [Nilaparvata lugens]BAP87099.1 hypothetical protein [Nilaparvata lugens]
MRTNMWFFSAITFVVLSSVTCFPFPLLSPFSNFPSFPSISAFPSIPNLSLQPVAFAALPLTSSPLGSISFTTKCQVVDNVKDLEFPKIEGTLENEQKRTFLCTDKTNRNFYFLTTSGHAVSGRTRETKNAGEYYSLNHKKLDIEKDLDIDENALWQAVAKAETTYDSYNSLYSSAFSHPLYSSLLTGAKASCKPLEKNFEDSCYPSVDINIGDVAKLENVYSTEICTGADNTPYYKLKTTANVVSKSGVKSSKYIVYSYPKGDDDKPDLTRKIGQESGAGAAGGVVASSFQSLTF